MSIKNSYIPSNISTSASLFVTASELVSQSFTTTSQYRVTSISMYLRAISASFNGYKISLYASDVNGKPTGASLLSGYIVIYSVDHVLNNGAGWYEFALLSNSTTVLSNSTDYVLVLESNVSDGTAWALMGYSEDNPLSGKAFQSTNAGSTWFDTNTSALNFMFKVEGVDPSPAIATYPSPADAADSQPSDIDLSWTNGAGTETVDMYFGTVTPPVTKVIDDSLENTYDPGVLSIDTFYWRVDTKNAYGTTTGTVWSFTTGTQIEVSNKAELQAMKDNPTASYKLTADIDCTGAWTPIGNPSDGIFSGILDGNGHTISNVTISTANAYQGLFGWIGSNALIYDLNLVDISITAGYRAGCFAGSAGQCTLSNIHVSGTSLVDTGASPDDYHGGFIGAQDSGVATVYDCSTNAIVNTGSSSYYCGGFVGWLNQASYFQKCLATGNVTATQIASYAGGFVGRVDVSGAVLVDCYAHGDVTGAAIIGYAGGFVGLLDSGSDIISSYSIGTVSSDGTREGGFCGENNGTITDCWYDSTTSGQSDSGKGEPETTANMMKIATFVNWDFTDATGVWNITDDITYPLFELMPSSATPTAPTDGGVNVSQVPTLTWDAGSPYTPESYNLYFGEETGYLVPIKNTTDLDYTFIVSLSQNTKYYWRVDSVGTNKTVEGDEQSFTTLAFNPPAPSESGGFINGLNGMVTVKRAVMAANNKIWYET